MYVSDALSRLPAGHTSPTTLPLDVCISLVQFTPSRLEELREETGRDDTMYHLKKVILHGWPGRRCEAHPAIRPFWSVRDSLVIDDGLVIKGTAVVIPDRPQQWYLERLHEGHQGRVKMELRARDAIYWPTLKKDVEARVAACLPCQTSRPAASASTIEPERQHSVPAVAWTEVSTDLFFCNGKNYILVVDHFSKYRFVYEPDEHHNHPGRQSRRSTVLRARIAEYRVLRQRSSVQFEGVQHVSGKTFGFQHVTSSPHHPQSNGIAERHGENGEKPAAKVRREQHQVPDRTTLTERANADRQTPSRRRQSCCLAVKSTYSRDAASRARKRPIRDSASSNDRGSSARITMHGSGTAARSRRCSQVMRSTSATRPTTHGGEEL